MDLNKIRFFHEDLGNGFFEAIQIFQKGLFDRLETFRLAVENNDPKELRFLAHKLKGTCKMFGLSRMVELVEKLEQISRSGTVKGAKPLVKKLLAEGRLAGAALVDYCSTVD